MENTIIAFFLNTSLVEFMWNVNLKSIVGFRINNGEFITFGKLLLKLKAPETISATKNISRNKTKNISECIKQNEQVSETEIVAENVNISPEECQENDTKVKLNLKIKIEEKPRIQIEELNFDFDFTTVNLLIIVNERIQL